MSEEKQVGRPPKKMRLAECHIYQGFNIGIENQNTLNPFKNQFHEFVEIYATNTFVEINNVKSEEVWLVPYANVKYCRPWPKDENGDDLKPTYYKKSAK